MRRIIAFIIVFLVLPLSWQGAYAKKNARKRAHVSRIYNNSNLSPLERKVVGKHLLSLQWISWDYYGECVITKEADGTLRCVGRQDSRENDDYLAIDGVVTIVDESHLLFEGDIRIKVHHIKNGEEYVRSGSYDFVATGKRKYWRMQQINNGECADYVDIYFKR